MDAALYAKMLSDNAVCDLKKLSFKYPKADLAEFISLLKSGVYRHIPLCDFAGNDLVFLSTANQPAMNTVKLLLKPPDTGKDYGIKAMEQEIASTFSIESIDFSRDSVRRILKGYAPADEGETRIFGMKKGLEFITEREKPITEANIHALYRTAIGDYLEDGDKLLPGSFYRHDEVFIVGQTVEHRGLPHTKLPAYMAGLVEFINTEDTLNVLHKGAAIHFYLSFLHPYFDGNGRMARLLHLWFLLRQGFSGSLFVPFSSFIERSRKGYYNAFTLTEQNVKISGVTDITPFLNYFTENVYNKLPSAAPRCVSTGDFENALKNGSVTGKENDLWQFVLSVYGTEEFSTKQLEKDFQNAAYATIRGFVLKFEKLGLLRVKQYGSRVKYRIP